MNKEISHSSFPIMYKDGKDDNVGIFVLISTGKKLEIVTCQDALN